jgi:hypothetical protein
MAIQFLDERLSLHRSNSMGTDILSETPILIGDLGIQTVAAIGTGNAANVRVALSGTVGVIGVNDLPSLIADIVLTVERNGSGIAGTGIIILEEVVATRGLGEIGPPLSVTASDFPPAAAVLAGQIRYSLFVKAIITVGGIILSGPVAFHGVACAGNTT